MKRSGKQAPIVKTFLTEAADIIRLQFLAGIGIEQQLERDIRLTAHKLNKQLGRP